MALLASLAVVGVLVFGRSGTTTTTAGPPPVTPVVPASAWRTLRADPDPASAGRDHRRRRHRLGDRRHHAGRRVEPDGGLRPGHRHLEDRHPAAGRAVPRDGRHLPRRDRRARRLGGPGRQPHGGELEEGVRAARRGLGGAAADAVVARRGRARWSSATRSSSAAGQADGKLDPTTEVFDGTAWKRVADMPTPREHLRHGHRRQVRVRGRAGATCRRTRTAPRWSATTRRPTRGQRSRPCPRRAVGSAPRWPTGGWSWSGGEEPTARRRLRLRLRHRVQHVVGRCPRCPPAPRARGRRGRQDRSTRSAAPRSPATRRPPGWARRFADAAAQAAARAGVAAAEGRAGRAPVRGHHGGGRQDVGAGRAHAGRGHAGRLRLRPGDRHVDARARPAAAAAPPRGGDLPRRARRDRRVGARERQPVGRWCRARSSRCATGRGSSCRR